jgi:uncharacterized protein YkwD
MRRDCTTTRRGTVLAATAVAVATLLTLLPWAGPSAGAAPAAPTSATAESQFAAKINAERTARGLSALQLDVRLAATARDWSGSMRAANRLYHDPGLAQDAAAVEPAWRGVAENVGVGYDVTSLHNAFMASSGHRANILNASYNRVGVGVVYAGSKLWVTVRFLNGPSLASASTAVAPSQRGAFVADFTGDGVDDVFVYGPGSATDEFHVGSTSGRFTRRSVSVSGHYKPVAGDFDGDGRAEVLWYGVGSAPDSIWEWNGSTWTSKGLSIGGDYRPVAGDFDGDGRDDVVWYGLGTRADGISWGTSTFGTLTRASFSITGSYRLATGDLDGDGYDDLLLYGPGSGTDKILWGRSSRSFVQQTIGAGGDYRPAIGDLDGRGGDDIVWYGPGSAGDAIWYMQETRGRFTRVARSAGGNHLPAVGDVNGDGVEDILWYSPTSAVGDTIWYGRFGSTGTSSSSVRS